MSVETAWVTGGESAVHWPLDSSVDNEAGLVFVNRGLIGCCSYGVWQIFPLILEAARASCYRSSEADGCCGVKALFTLGARQPISGATFCVE